MPDLAPTDIVLREAMNMRPVREYRQRGAGAPVHVYEMGEGGPAAELHVAVEPGLRAAPRRAPAACITSPSASPIAEYDAWASGSPSCACRSAAPVDRFYFRSLYFREPNGILFEIATDGPGFAADEPLATLGERLALPPFLEPRRKAIEAGLKPL